MFCSPRTVLAARPVALEVQAPRYPVLAAAAAVANSCVSFEARKGIEAMNEPIVKGIPTCASCRHKVYRDRANVICYGAPPTPIPMGGGKNMAGQDIVHFEMIRPQIRATERACAVYQPQEGEALLAPEPARPDFAGVDLSALARRN